MGAHDFLVTGSTLLNRFRVSTNNAFVKTYHENFLEMCCNLESHGVQRLADHMCMWIGRLVGTRFDGSRCMKDVYSFIRLACLHVASCFSAQEFEDFFGALFASGFNPDCAMVSAMIGGFILYDLHWELPPDSDELNRMVTHVVAARGFADNKEFHQHMTERNVYHALGAAGPSVLDRAYLSSLLEGATAKFDHSVDYVACLLRCLPSFVCCDLEFVLQLARVHPQKALLFAKGSAWASPQLLGTCAGVVAYSVTRAERLTSSDEWDELPELDDAESAIAALRASCCADATPDVWTDADTDAAGARRGSLAWEKLSDDMRADTELMLRVVDEFPDLTCVLLNADADAPGMDDVVRYALGKLDGDRTMKVVASTFFMKEDFFYDLAVLRRALELWPVDDVLRNMCPCRYSNRQWMLLAAKYGLAALEYVAVELLRDPELVLATTEIEEFDAQLAGYFFQMIDASLLSDHAFLLECAPRVLEVLDRAPDSLLSDPAFVRKLLAKRFAERRDGANAFLYAYARTVHRFPELLEDPVVWALAHTRDMAKLERQPPDPRDGPTRAFQLIAEHVGWQLKRNEAVFQDEKQRDRLIDDLEEACVVPFNAALQAGFDLDHLLFLKSTMIDPVLKSLHGACGKPPADMTCVGDPAVGEKRAREQ